MNPNDLTRDGLRIMPDVMPTDPVLAAHLALYGWAIARLTPHALVVVDWGCGAGYCASMLASGAQLHESSFAAMTAHVTFGFNDVGHVGSGKNLTLIIEASDAA